MITIVSWKKLGAIAFSYPLTRVSVRATVSVKLRFFMMSLNNKRGRGGGGGGGGGGCESAIAPKIKDISQNFANAVTEGRRSGSGKIVMEFYEQLVKL